MSCDLARLDVSVIMGKKKRAKELPRVGSRDFPSLVLASSSPKPGRQSADYIPQGCRGSNLHAVVYILPRKNMFQIRLALMAVYFQNKSHNLFWPSVCTPYLAVIRDLPACRYIYPANGLHGHQISGREPQEAGQASE